MSLEAQIEQVQNQLQRIKRTAYAGWLLALSALVIPFTMGAATGPGGKGSSAQAEERTPQPQQPGGLIAQVQRLESKVHRLQEFNPPVGTVMAYLGQWPPYKTRDGKQRWTEGELGWMLCDGRELDASQYEELFIALQGTARAPAKKKNHFRLPDLQGMFLRGIDRRATQPADPDGKRQVGSKQEWATGRPRAGFKTNVVGSFDPANGAYKYLLKKDGKRTATGFDDNDTGGREPNLFEVKRVRIVPAHDHTVIGGDKETRPVNIAVHWIIKFRSTN